MLDLVLWDAKYRWPGAVVAAELMRESKAGDTTISDTESDKFKEGAERSYGWKVRWQGV